MVLIGKAVLAWALTVLLLPAVAYAACDEDESVNGIPEDSIAPRLPPAVADLGGARSSLAVSGIIVGANYTGGAFAHSSGGAVFDTSLELYTDVDLQKAVGWKGLCFHLSAYPVTDIQAVPSGGIDELWFEQHLFGDAATIRVGQLSPDSEFLTSVSQDYFVNNTWGWPSMNSLDLTGGSTTYPSAAPGIRLALNPNDRFGLLFAIFEDAKLSALLMAEAAYKYNQEDDELPGTIKLGAWKNVGDLVDRRFNSAGLAVGINGNPAQMLNDDFGIYAIIDQLLFRVPADDPKGVGVFARVVAAPSASNLFEFYADTGLTFTGLIPHRSSDALAIGLAFTGVVDNGVGVNQALATKKPDTLAEICYTAKIIHGWTIKPDFQYVWRPDSNLPERSDREQADDAMIFGVNTNIEF